MQPKHVVLLEDHHIQAESFVKTLHEKYPGVRLDVLNTEKEFVDRLDNYLANPPDLFILDVMARWTDPSPDDAEVPEDVQNEGFWLAGVRCERRLRARQCNVPAVLYTVLVEDDLKADKVTSKFTKLITKEPNFDGLHAAIESF